MRLLVGAFSPAAAATLMCRDTLSVRWDGRCAPGEGRGSTRYGAASSAALAKSCRLLRCCCHASGALIGGPRVPHVADASPPLRPAVCGSPRSFPRPPFYRAPRLYDCDFNQQLDLPLPSGARTVFDLASLAGLPGARVATACHCFGCTAGEGSSCQGATA
jgi:hypothetical protein